MPGYGTSVRMTTVARMMYTGTAYGQCVYVREHTVCSAMQYIRRTLIRAWATATATATIELAAVVEIVLDRHLEINSVHGSKQLAEVAACC